MPDMAKVIRARRSAAKSSGENPVAAAMPAPEALPSNAGVDIHWLGDEEARQLFDGRARYWLGISGEEFLRRWDAGEFADDPDRTEVQSVAILMDLVR